MGRSPCCAKEGLNRGAWTVSEDQILTEYIKIHGEGKWRNLPKKAGLKRCGKSCRLRWLNYLRPDIKRGNISHDEEELIIRLHKLLGNRWSLIAGRLPGRTDNEIKNYWNTNIGKKLQKRPTKPSYRTFVAEKSVSESGKESRESYPIRTKATKCTKMFYNVHQDQVFQTKQIMVATSMVDHRSNDHQNAMNTSESPPEFNLEEDNPSNFMIDFEMDEHFLSFLNSTDFSGMPIFDAAVGGDSSANTTNTNSGETLLFSEDKPPREMDFPSMDMLIGSELEWFRE